MDHDVVVRQHMTERYLLDELDSEARSEFEDHFFECHECALDVRAGAMFIEHSKVVLAEDSATKPLPAPAPEPAPVRPGWMRWLRPALVPAMVVLLAVIGYQNLVVYPRMQQALSNPQVLPWAQVNVGTYGSGGPVITTRPGQGFLMFVRIPPDQAYSRYMVELYNPGGKLEWSLAIPAASTEDQWPVQVPGANREPGNYGLAVRGITPAGDSKEVGRASFELQVQR
jgi:anti-sigma factor RsiW